MFCQNKRHTNLNLSGTYKWEPHNYSIAVLSLKNDNILVILNLKFNKKQICKTGYQIIFWTAKMSRCGIRSCVQLQIAGLNKLDLGPAPIKLKI